MLELRCFWAGQMVQTHQVKSSDVTMALQEIEKDLKKGLITFTTVGSKFVVTELCIDVYDGKVLVDMHQLKQKT